MDVANILHCIIVNSSVSLDASPNKIHQLNSWKCLTFVHLPLDVTGRLVPGLPPRKAASIEPVPGLLDVPGRFDVPGLANPVRGLPLPVTGRTAGLNA